MIRACAAVGGWKTARTLSRRWISCCRRVACGLVMALSSGGDEAVDLAVAEQPAAVLLDHLVEISATRAVRAVLHHRPVGADLGLFAVERYRDVGDQMDRARPAVARPAFLVGDVERHGASHLHMNAPNPLRAPGSIGGSIVAKEPPVDNREFLSFRIRNPHPGRAAIRHPARPSRATPPGSSVSKR